MINVLNTYINYVEEHYHSDFTEDDIKNITGYSYHHFSRVFKEKWHMTPQTYRKRRQLTLIALEIKINSSSIKGSDLSPWADDNTFSKAFKREFDIRPSEYIKGGYFYLQNKLEISPDIYMDYILKNYNKYLEKR